MKMVNTKELSSETRTYVESAEEEREEEKSYVDKEWVNEFLAIPEEFRVNPFEISPSGDLYYADKRNVDALDEAIACSKREKGVERTVEEIREMFGQRFRAAP